LLNPDVAAITAARRQVRLISDSPDVRRLISQQEACQPLERAEIDRFEAEATRLTQKWDREATQEAAPASGIGPAPGTLHPGANKVS